MRYALLIAVLAVGLVAPVLAEEAGEEDLPVMTGGPVKPVDPAQTLGTPPEIGTLVARTIGALAVVFVGLGLFLWLLKRFSVGQARGKTGLLDVIETRPVLPRWSLSVVRFGDELLLLSHSGDRVSVLSSTQQDADARAQEPPEEKQDFRRWLADSLSRAQDQVGKQEESA